MRKIALAVGLGVLALLLGGCGLFGAPSPVLGETPVIQGKVQNWPGGSGTVYFTDLLGSGAYSLEGTVNSQGYFSVRMKSGAELDKDGLLHPMYTSENDTCTLRVEPDGVRVAAAQLLYYEPADAPIWYVDSADPAKISRHAFLWYAEQDATITTQGVDCGGLEWDMKLKKGWNWVIVSETNDGSSVKTAFPQGFVWIYDLE